MLTSHTGLLLEMVVYQGANLWCNTSTGALQPLVPVSQRRAVFKHVHQISHAERGAVRRLVAACFVWPGLATDVVAWCKECAACNCTKVTRQPTTTVDKMAIPAARFSHVHMDIGGPLPPSSKVYTHLLIMVDRSTRWLEAVLLRDANAEVVLDANQYHYRQGCPVHICHEDCLVWPVWGATHP